LITVSRKRSKIISFDDLIEDPALNEEYRDILREFKKKPVKSQDAAKDLLDQLDAYRKTRHAYYLAKNVIDKLKEPEVDIDALLDETTDRLSHARSRETMVDALVTIGKDANAEDLAEEAMSPEDETLLKSGFTEFDSRNGGLPSEGVMLLAATTSGGKSVTRMNLMKNIYKLNSVSVCTVSLEMNAKKETRRMLSNLTGIPFWKFNKKRLRNEEKDIARKAWKKFHKFGVKNDCAYSLLCPTRSLSIQQLLMLVKPYKFRAIAIDYISLLDGTDSSDQWKVLSAITRECKVFSAENKCLVILLAQLDSEDDRIRYSKGILEHADNAWIWNYSKQEQRDMKTLPIKQLKARDQELFPFDLKEHFEIMTVLNPEDPTPEIKELNDPSSGGNRGSTGDDDVDPLKDEAVDYDVS
jgi:replicative DNA helicase